VNALRIDRQTKFKMIGASLTLIRRCAKVQERTEMQQAFESWKQSNKVQKVVDTAFNKMLELNYRHAKA
jgi:hypothetical protein